MRLFAISNLSKYLANIPISCFFATHLLTLTVISAQSIAAEQASSQNQTMQATDTLGEKLPTSVDLIALEKKHSADDSFWLEIENNQVLVLKHWSSGRVFRGNVILLHAQGEHADHPRFTRSLAKQLTPLGWQVFIPNLPDEDFPIEKIPLGNLAEQTSLTDKQTDNSANTSNAEVNQEQKEQPMMNTTFFANKQGYQKLFTQILNQVINKVDSTNDPLVIVANQNSAFWILDAIKNNNKPTQIVLFHPQQPHNELESLDVQFTGQTLPVMTFIQDPQKSNAFIRSFAQHFWQATNQRTYQNDFSFLNLEEENMVFAKMISGWVLSQKQN